MLPKLSLTTLHVQKKNTLEVSTDDLDIQCAMNEQEFYVDSVLWYFRLIVGNVRRSV